MKQENIVEVLEIILYFYVILKIASY